MFYRPLKFCPEKTVIFETDFRGDVDDAGALSILLAYAKKYGFKVGGISVNDKDQRENLSAEAVYAFLKSRSFEKTPIAVGDVTSNNGAPYLPGLAARLTEEEKKDVIALSPEELYKTVLSGVPDGSVTVISVGFFGNLDRARNADPALFDRKVGTVIAMAGAFLYKEGYREYNVTYSQKEEAEHFTKNYGGCMLFSGFEVGNTVFTNLISARDSEDEAISAYRDFCRFQRPGYPFMVRESWDPLTVDFAVNGEGCFYRLSESADIYFEDGFSVFREDPSGKCAFVIRNAEDEVLGKRITELILSGAVK